MPPDGSCLKQRFLYRQIATNGYCYVCRVSIPPRSSRATSFPHILLVLLLVPFSGDCVKKHFWGQFFLEALLHTPTYKRERLGHNALAPRLPTGEGGHAGEDWPQGVCTSGCSGSMRGLKWRAPLRLHTAAIADGRGVCLKLFY